MPEQLTYEELQLQIAEQEKALTDFKVEYQKYLEEQAKIKAESDKVQVESDKALNEQFEKYLKSNEDNAKQINTLSGEIDDLKTLIANDNAINPESLTYTVEVSQDQLEKMKVKEKEYLDLAVIWVSIFVAIALSYVGIRGMFGKWMR